jgi:hypothetical protein
MCQRYPNFDAVGIGSLRRALIGVSLHIASLLQDITPDSIQV